MKCIKCKSNNSYHSNYCKKCGNKFTKQEKDKAKRWTLVWFLEKKDQIQSLWKFNFITDHILFKIASLLIILAIGIYSFLINGSHLKLLTGDNYKLQYNTKLDEYYLLAEENNIKLNLYIPEKADKLVVTYFDKDDKVIEEKTYNKNDVITIVSDSSDSYYLIRANYNNKGADSLKIFVYQEEEDTNE